MVKYELYENQNLYPKVKSDLERIRQILNYDGPIYIRDGRFITEFLLSEYNYTKNSFIFINRIIDRVISDIRFGRTKEYKLLIVIEKFGDFFETESVKEV